MTSARLWTNKYELDENGESSVTKITNETGLGKNEVQRAIGWLLKEDKLNIETNGRAETVSLKN